jgi:AcrR family transcriptional regulator
MAEDRTDASPRRRELARRAYEYVSEHGLAELSLRPLADAIGTSAGVLMFLFGSKDGVVRAILAEARADELAMLDEVRRSSTRADRATVARTVWTWLAAAEHRRLLNLWVEAYGRSLIAQDGPLAGFAAETVRDWLQMLDAADGRDGHSSTAVLALLRGSMLDLLATGDGERVTAALERALGVTASRPSSSDTVADTPTTGGRMGYAVDFANVSTVGLESSPVSDALAGLRANEARYFKNKYDHTFTVVPADEAQAALEWVNRILSEERGLTIGSRPLEVSRFEVDGIRMAYVFYESGLSINVMYTIADGGKRAVGFKLAEGMEVPEELASSFKFARQKSKLAGVIRGSYFVIKGEY